MKYRRRKNVLYKQCCVKKYIQSSGKLWSEKFNAAEKKVKEMCFNGREIGQQIITLEFMPLLFARDIKR